MYEATGHNPLLAGVAAGVTSLAMEAGLANRLGHGLRMMPRTVERYRQQRALQVEPLLDPPESTTWSRLKAGFNQVRYAITLGTPGSVMGSFISEPEKDLSVHVRKGYIAAAGLAVANTVTLAALTGALYANEKVGSNPGLSQHVVDWFVEKPYGYLVLVGILNASSIKRGLVKGIKRLRSKNQANPDIPSEPQDR